MESTLWDRLPMRLYFLFLALCAALVAFFSGCATQGAITAPDLRVRLPAQTPVAVVEPLVSVYRAIPYETILDRKKEEEVSRVALESAREHLAGKGWETLAVAPVDWTGLLAGYPLDRQQPLAADARSRAFAEVLQQLDRIGQRLRVHHQREGIPHVKQGVSAFRLASQTPDAASYLFLAITGCFGQLTEGPCRNIQFPQPLHTPAATEFPNVQTVPWGMAIHLYWLEAATGRLLWYDDFTRHNLNPGYGKDVKVLVEKGLAEFPPRP